MRRHFSLEAAGSEGARFRGRPPSERVIRHAWLTDLITKVHVESRGTYGARRVHAELTIGMGILVGHNAVEMLMRRAELQGLPNKRRFKTKIQVGAATDLVERSFAPVRAGPTLGHRHHRAPDPGRQGLLLRRAGCVLPPSCRPVHRFGTDRGVGDQCPWHGDQQPRSGGNAPTFGSRGATRTLPGEETPAS